MSAFFWLRPTGPDLKCPACDGTRFVAVNQVVNAKLWRGRTVLVPEATDLVCRSCSAAVEFSAAGLRLIPRPGTRAPARPSDNGSKPPADEPPPPDELDTDLAMPRAERRRRDRQERSR